MATKNPEALLISAVIRSGEYQVLAAQGITADLFHDFKDEALWLEQYIARNGKAPSKGALRQAYPDFTLFKVDDCAHFCELVRKAHKSQATIDLMDTVLELIEVGDEDTALQTMSTGITLIESITQGQRPNYDLFEQVEDVYASVSKRVMRARTTGYAGVPSGFASLDSLTGGFQPGWFCVVAARLGEGKTWTGVRMGFAAAVKGHKVNYFSLEQSRLQIAMRMHSFGSRQWSSRGTFNPLDLNRGTGVDLIQYKKFLKNMREKHGSGKFVVNDTSRGRVSPATIAAAIETEQPNIVIVDYLTLLSASTDDWRGTAKLSADIQTMAQRYDIPIVALSQVNRLGIGKEPPGAENLSQADAIGQDADLVMTQKQMSKRVMKHRVAKFRHGPSGGTWFSNFSPGTGNYDEVTSDVAQAMIVEDQEDD